MIKKIVFISGREPNINVPILMRVHYIRRIQIIKMKKLLPLWCSLLSLWSYAQKSSSVSFETWLSLKQAGPAIMSADGYLVALCRDQHRTDPDHGT